MENSIQKNSYFNALTKKMKKPIKVNTLTKAQVTSFMILGIVILSAFILVFYLVNTLTKENLEKQTLEIAEELLSKSALNFYTSECLDDALIEGLILIGNQGGYIFKDQPGSVFGSDLPSITLAGANISKLIVSQNPAPQFPCAGGIAPDFCMFKNILPPGEPSYPLGKNLLPRLDKGDFSIRAQLESYIEHRTQECTNFQNIIELEGLQQYNVQEQPLEAKVTFSQASVTADLNYPITLTLGDRPQPILHLLKFKSTAQIRFKDIYNVIDDMLKKETQYLNFNISKHSFDQYYNNQYNLINAYTGFEFTSIENPPADIFQLTDRLSELMPGQAYVFQFARENRPPALDYTNKSRSIHEPLDPKIYDYYLEVGETITLKPSAIDPDEDKITIGFGGDLGASQLTSSFNTPPIGIASYLTTTNDIGLKYIRISASDAQLEDFQQLRVLVERKLEANAEASHNSYPGIANNLASIEDPYYLDASQTTELEDLYVDYNYQWYGAGISVNKPYKCIAVPGYENCSKATFDINTIRNQAFTSLGNNQQITLIVTATHENKDKTLQTDTTTKTIDVKLCLPHRSSSLPYPYNPSDVDPFQADHACCKDDGTYEGITKSCYQKQEYICNSNQFTLDRKDTRRYCTGARGNTCEGQITTDWTSLNQCGTNALPGCSGINLNCESFTPFGLRINKGWCYGNQGCDSFCTKPVVDTNNDGVQDACGCSGNKDKPCDSNFDGTFDGICKGVLQFYKCE